MPWELPQFLDPEMVRTGWRELASLETMNALVRPLESLRGYAKEQMDFLRVSAMEMSFYMRSQLLRDADWAGMAQSVEIRPPLVDIELLRALAPSIATLTPGAGKAALASAPRTPLPAEIVSRAKTGFFVPTGAWMAEAAGRAAGAAKPPAKGLASRQWARQVFRAAQGAPGATPVTPAAVAA